MTAVAPPPSFVQSMPRSMWTNGSQNGSMTQMTPEEVSRLLMPPRTKTITRPSSSASSTSSISSNDSGMTALPNNWAKKKPTRNNWSSKPLDGNPRSNGTAISVLGSVGGISAGASTGVNVGSYLILLPLNDTFERKVIPLPYFPDVLRIGRQTNAKTIPTQSNGFFDSKVLSRQHAEIWAEKGSGRVFIRDIKSSNGTFVNGTRLSPENRESEAHEVRAEDVLELGIDIVGEDNKTIVHHKVAARVEHSGPHHGANNTGRNTGFDLNFGDIDPGTGTNNSGGGSAPGGGLMAPPTNHVQTGGRGRSNSQTSRGSALSNPGIGLGPRQPSLVSNMPITMENIVKRLHFELQQAKQQSKDLKRTSDLLDKLLVSRPEEHVVLNEKNGLQETLNQSEISIPDVEETDNSQIDRSKSEKSSLHQFPRTPPPEFDVPSIGKDMDDMSVINEKMHSVVPNNLLVPAKTTKPDPPQQIMGLVTALATAKKDLEEKTIRCQELEETLKKERVARESAEDRAERLELASISQKTTTTPTPAPDVAKHKDVGSQSSLDATPSPSESEDKRVTQVTEIANKLQLQVDSILLDLQSTKSELETFKERALKAESETVELVEKMRKNEEARSKTSTPVISNGLALLGTTKSFGSALHGSNSPEAGPGVMSKVLSMSTVEQKDGNATRIDIARFAQEGAPYMSILGVVIFGVGLMVVLNGLQKGER